MTQGNASATLRLDGLGFELGSALVAGGLALGVIATVSQAPLSTFVWAAAFLFLIAESDLRVSRIPNVITFPALAIALGIGFASGGGAAVLAALAGAGTAFALLFLPFALRALGAGDVKAMMVLGALFGPQAAFTLVVWLVGISGAVAIARVGLGGELGDLARRWGHAALAFRSTGKFTYFAPQPGSAAASRMPLGLLIGLAVIARNLWGTPWNF